MLFAIALLTAALTPPPRLPQPQGACLHFGGGETPEQRDRSVAGLGAARAVNTAQSEFAAKNARKYATREQLPSVVDPHWNVSPTAEIAPGWRLTLDATDKGYWFEIVDTRDPCGFRYVSNQSGLILAAQPIR